MADRLTDQVTARESDPPTEARELEAEHSGQWQIERRMANGGRQPVIDKWRTTNGEPGTTNDKRKTTND